MSAEEKALAKSMLDAIILKNQVAGAVRQLTPTPEAKGEEARQYETNGARRRQINEGPRSAAIFFCSYRAAARWGWFFLMLTSIGPDTSDGS